jgi:hypothetical protein
MTVLINANIACGAFVVGAISGVILGFIIGAGMGYLQGMRERKNKWWN